MLAMKNNERPEPLTKVNTCIFSALNYRDQVLYDQFRDEDVVSRSLRAQALENLGKALAEGKAYADE